MANGSGFDWQSMIPMMMAGVAGAMDPMHANQIGQSGWMAAKMRMAQEEMEREREERAERMKMAQEEMKLRQQQMQINESIEKRQQEAYGLAAQERAAGEWLMSKIPQLMGQNSGKAQPSYGQLLTQLNALAKEDGMKLTPDHLKMVQETYEQSAYFPTGNALIIPGPNGPIAYWGEQQGKNGPMEFKQAELSDVPPQVMPVLLSKLQDGDPRAMAMVGEYFSKKPETKALGDYFTKTAVSKSEQIRTEHAGKIAGLQLEAIRDDQKSHMEELNRQWAEPPVNLKPGSAEEADWMQRRDKAYADSIEVYRALRKRVMESMIDKSVLDDIDKRKKEGGGKKEEPFQGSPRQMADYKDFLETLAATGMPAVEAARTAKALIKKFEKLGRYENEEEVHEEVEGMPIRPAIPKTSQQVRQFGGIGPPQSRYNQWQGYLPFGQQGMALEQGVRSMGQQAMDWWERNRRRSAWERMQQTR